jgi:hypothetical protein
LVEDRRVTRFGLLAWLGLLLFLGSVSPARAADADYDLAFTNRPLLLFDATEKWRPLNVEVFMGESRYARQHHVCLTGAGTCDSVVAQPGDLNDGGILDIAGEARKGADYVTPRPGDCREPPPVVDCDTGARSAIYYDVFRNRGKPIIDYWWFLRFNYVPFAGVLKCRLKAVCLDHEGDWEGVRVIPPHGREALEVHYDAHGRSESYLDLEPEVRDGRPVVYIAHGTHSAYPRPCAPTEGVCRETGARLPEGRFDGQAPWGRNLACSQTCLLALPARSWARWPGLWGRACDRRSCHRREGPKSPRQQTHRARLCLTGRTAFTSISVRRGIFWALRQKISPRSECV